MFDFDALPPMPHSLQTLVWAALGVAAVATIWDKLQGRRWGRIIIKELTNNSGTSMKDMMEQAAKDSKEALELTKTLDRRTESIRHRQAGMQKVQAATSKRVGVIEQDVKGMMSEQIAVRQALQIREHHETNPSD